MQRTRSSSLRLAHPAEGVAIGVAGLLVAATLFTAVSGRGPSSTTPPSIASTPTGASSPAATDAALANDESQVLPPLLLRSVPPSIGVGVRVPRATTWSARLTPSSPADPQPTQAPPVEPSDEGAAPQPEPSPTSTRPGPAPRPTSTSPSSAPSTTAPEPTDEPAPEPTQEQADDESAVDAGGTEAEDADEEAPTSTPKVPQEALQPPVIAAERTSYSSSSSSSSSSSNSSSWSATAVE